MLPLLSSVLLLLACARCSTGAARALAQADASGDVDDIPEVVGIFARGETSAEEAALDARGAARVEEVFLHRLSRVLANETLRASFNAALDVVLDAPAQLPKVFSGAPPYSQLLPETPSGGSAAVRAIELARNLATLSGGAAASSTAGAGGAAASLDAATVITALRQLSEALAQLPPASCHPVTRRVVVAALVRLQLRLHPQGAAAGGGADAAAVTSLRSSPDLRLLLFRCCRLLYAKHRQGAASKGAVEFLHVSKSGGTSMCAVADRNGCSAESITNYGNCMVRRFDDRPRWVSAAVHNKTAPLDGWRWYYRYLERRGQRTCEYRDELLRRKRFTFFSNEFATHGGLDDWRSAHLCPSFLNVILLREPLARLVSHVRWIIKVYRTEYGRAFEPFFRGRDADYWRAFAPAAVDNYYTRLLLGEATFYAPTGDLNATHLAAARLMLLQYDVVLQLEAADTDDLFLRHALGWRVGLSSARARVAAHHRAASELVPYDLDELLAANDLDAELYGFGTAVHALDGLVLAAAAAAGLSPYGGYLEIDPADSAVGRRVRCGYVGRKAALLAAVGENATLYDARPYGEAGPGRGSHGRRMRGEPRPRWWARVQTPGA